jgi:metal-dependent amidase/aminoacylase/carboxypeptidase family protein
VQGCFEGAAIATGCKVETKWGASDYLDMKTNWAMAQAYEDNATALGREFFPMKDVPPGFAGSTDMGNVSHRVPSIHPMLAVAPPNVIIHNAEFAKWAGSGKGDQAVLDGAKSLAMTALDLMMTPRLLEIAKKDFEATKELSQTALAALHDPVVDHVPHAHGCGCA